MCRTLLRNEHVWATTLPRSKTKFTIGHNIITHKCYFIKFYRSKKIESENLHNNNNNNNNFDSSMVWASPQTKREPPTQNKKERGREKTLVVNWLRV